MAWHGMHTQGGTQWKGGSQSNTAGTPAKRQSAKRSIIELVASPIDIHIASFRPLTSTLGAVCLLVVLFSGDSLQEAGSMGRDGPYAGQLNDILCHLYRLRIFHFES